MPEEVAEIEAIADAGREDPGIDIGIAFDIDAAKGRVVAPGDVEPGLLHVGVGIPAIAERNVETCLQREAERIVDAALCDAAALEAFPAALLSSHATLLRTRPRQSLALTVDLGETAFIVGAGTLSVHITLGTTSQAVTLLFPGDLFRSSFAPPQAKAALVSAAKAEVWRLRASALEELATRDPAIARFVDQALVNQMARRAMHAVMLGQFDGEQKVATFLAQVRNSRRA